jgi:hypothetical protein
MDITMLTPEEQNLVIRYSAAQREISMLGLITRPGPDTTEHENYGNWLRFKRESAAPIHESFMALVKLRQSDNPYSVA